MQAFRHGDSLRHDPDRYFRRGAIISHPEQVERYRLLL